MTFRFLFACALLAAARLPAVPVGIGSQYDVIVKNDFVIHGSRVHGTSAVGGNLVLNGNKSDFGLDLAVNAGPAVVVAGNIVMNSDAQAVGSKKIEVGSLTGGQTIGSQGLSGNGKKFETSSGGVAVGPVGIDFDAAFDEFSLLSQTMAGLASTKDLASLTSGDAQNRQLNLNFTTGSSYEVLNLSFADFESFKNIQVGNPAAGSNSWIINVDLTGYAGGTITQNRNGSNEGADLILWNFFNASSLSLANQFYGTVFAPNLDFTHVSNDLKGQVIASSFTKLSGQVHIHTYDGYIPPPPSHDVPDSGTSAFMLIASLGLLAGIRRASR